MRCLDVLLGVLAHDPSLVRRAVLGQLLEAKTVANLGDVAEGSSSGGEEAADAGGGGASVGGGWSARALPAGLVGLLARSEDV